MSQQDTAFEMISDWFPGTGKQEFYLSGYAGVGKTWLASKLPEKLGLPTGEGGLMYGAYTGKAASVLHAKGCTGASTLHSLIYIPQAKGREELRNLQTELEAASSKAEIKRLEKAIDKLELELAQPGFMLSDTSPVASARLLVVDEVSMVSDEMAEDLRSFGVPMIVMGDPAQLPPISGKSAFGADPDFLMTEIRRQEEGSPILSLATRARQGLKIMPGRSGDTSAYQRLAPYRIREHDIVLCGRNKTRQLLNQRIRRAMKVKSWHPIAGDKVICLENNKLLGLLNGHMFTVLDLTGHDEERKRLTLLVKDEDGNEREITTWADPFERFQDGEDGVKKMDYHRRQACAFMTFGHAITVHKSQGSQWNSVLLVDEARVFRNDASKWLYTGITRAARSLTLVRPNEVL